MEGHPKGPADAAAVPADGAVHYFIGEEVATPRTASPRSRTASVGAADRRSRSPGSLRTGRPEVEDGVRDWIMPGETPDDALVRILKETMERRRLRGRGQSPTASSGAQSGPPSRSSSVTSARSFRQRAVDDGSGGSRKRAAEHAPDTIEWSAIPADSDAHAIANIVRDSLDRMQSSVKRLRSIEESYLANGRDDSLCDHMQVHAQFIDNIKAENGKLEGAARQLEEQLRRERAERERERERD